MSAALPLELLQEILRLSLRGEGRAERQQTKLAFRRVCRTWYQAVDFWTELDILDFAQLGDLADLLANQAAAGCPAQLAHDIRAVHIELAASPPPADVDQLRQDIFNFFGQVGEVERIELVIDKSNLVGPTQQRAELSGLVLSQHWLDSVLVPALKQLRNVRHFELDGRRALCSCESFRTILSDWHKLENFPLRNCFLVSDDGAVFDSIWSSHPSLHTIRLGPFNNSPAITRSLASLPPSLRALAIQDDRLFSAWFDEPVRLFAQSLAPVMPSLTDLTLITASDNLRRVRAHRGQPWDELLAQAAELRTLKVNVCAVSDLSEVLLPLRHLREVELVQGHAEPTVPVAHGEVVKYLTRATGLRRLAIGREVWQAWSGEDVDEVRQQAGMSSTVLELKGDTPRAL